MSEEEKLEKKIEDAKEKLRQLKDKEKFSIRNQIIKKLDDYSTEDKVEWFNNMYESAMEELKELELDGYSNEDNAHYVWETYIQILAKNNSEFWTYWNSFD